MHPQVFTGEQLRRNYERTKKYLSAHPEKVRQWRANYLEAHREQRRIQNKRTYYLRAYGISPEQAEVMRQAQHSACAICGESLANGYHVDHDHETGKVRGLLCFNCNGGLGQFQDSIELLEAAQSYLRRSQTG